MSVSGRSCDRPPRYRFSFSVSLCLESKCWGGPQISKMSLHASHVAPTDVNVNFSSTVSSTCICVQNHCHRAKAQLQLNKYYYYYYYNKNASPMEARIPSTFRYLQNYTASWTRSSRDDLTTRRLVSSITEETFIFVSIVSNCYQMHAISRHSRHAEEEVQPPARQ
jgi:hypothetical protein